MRSLLVLQHQDDCPPGVLGDWAAARGVTLDVARPDRGELPDAHGFDAVAVLGSDQSVNGDAAWIAPELAWLRGAVEQAPVLGVCFGAQALAVTLGGEVRRETPEIDWLELDVDPSLRCGPGPWLCWHEDFITAPPGAEVLARSPRAVHAFRSGAHLAVQFHPEVTAEIVAEWAGVEELARTLAQGGVDVGRLMERTSVHAASAGKSAHALFDAFAESVG